MTSSQGKPRLGISCFVSLSRFRALTVFNGEDDRLALKYAAKTVSSLCLIYHRGLLMIRWLGLP